MNEHIVDVDVNRAVLARRVDAFTVPLLTIGVDRQREFVHFVLLGSPRLSALTVPSDLYKEFVQPSCRNAPATIGDNVQLPKCGQHPAS